MLEDYSEALVRRAAMDISSAVLINIDAHEDLRWISPEKVEGLQKILEHRNWQALQEADSPGDKGLYHIGSFICAAYHSGIISEIYWIIPFTHFQSPDALTELSRFLDDYGFQRQNIKNFVMDERCFKGLHYGILLIICDIHNLPHIPEGLFWALKLIFPFIY
ncbi:MAG: hypothetical protein ACLFP9_05635 [Desulfonatronovibrio sp.]